MKHISSYQRKLFVVWNKACSKARCQPDSVEQILDRLNKALGILQHHDYYQAEKELYSPNFASCGCKDWEWRMSWKRKYTGPCKHIMAEILRERVNRLSYEQTSFLGALETIQKAPEWTGKVWVSGILT